MSDKIHSTKVQGFWFFSIALVIALATDKLGEGGFISGMTLVLGIFSTANVMQKKILQDKVEEE